MLIFFSLQFSCLNFPRNSNKTISKKYLSNAHMFLTEDERGKLIRQFLFFIPKSIKENTPLMSPFSCNVFKEGLREINFFNLLLTRFLSFESEAL